MIETYLVIVAKEKKEQEADSAFSAIRKAFPEHTWYFSEHPSGVYEAGSYDGTKEMPFLAQVRKPNGIYVWFVNCSNPHAKYWKK